MCLLRAFLTFCLLLTVLFRMDYLVEGSSHYGKSSFAVTCGSTIKLANTVENVRLHSHDLKYAGGSEQQSVTAYKNADDTNSNWVVHAAVRKTCARGELVKCNAVIRLQHLNTRKWLQSHTVAAPLTPREQEVSGSGSPSQSDRSDNWIVLCDSEYWHATTTISLMHQSTGKFLSLSGQRYTQKISGQYEVVGTKDRVRYASWVAAEGVYMVPDDGDVRAEEEEEDD